jgi:predicted nucleotidyltransferase component of viral defense system
MVAKMPNSRRNLDIAIERVFGKDDNPLQVRTLMANTIIGQLLPNGAVKGGSSLKFRYGDKATRFTRDLDTVRAEDLDTFIRNLDAGLARGWNGFTGKVIRKDPAKPKNVPGEYVMQPFEIKLAYNNASWVTVQMEIGHDEVDDTLNPDLYISPDIITVFERLGFPAPAPVALMPVFHQFAQKLHAVSADGNARAHDLIDLQLILNNEIVDYTKVREVCQRLFAYRRLQEWPPTVSVGKDWDVLYENQMENLDVLPSVDEAVEWANNLIGKIEESHQRLELNDETIAAIEEGEVIANGDSSAKHYQSVDDLFADD